MMQKFQLNPVCSHRKYRQRGTALVMSLIILLVMTVIGVTAMQVTVLEEKMAGNLRHRSTAFQAAESALRDAETALTVAVLPTFNGSGGLYKATTPQKWVTLDWSDTSILAAYSGGTNLGALAETPTYIIEELEPVLGGAGSLEAGIPQQTDYYRVTSRGVGGSANAVVMLQSMYKR